MSQVENMKFCRRRKETFPFEKLSNYSIMKYPTVTIYCERVYIKKFENFIHNKPLLN